VTITVTATRQIEPNEWITVSFKNPRTPGWALLRSRFGVITNDD